MTASDVAQPPGRIAPADRRRGLKISILEALFAQSHSALTGLGVGGNALTFGFALLLGANDLALGLLAAIPPLLSAMQLVAAGLAPRLAHRRPVVVASSTAARVLWIACGALPFVLGPGPGSLAAFLALFALSCGLLSLSGNLWVSWMADLVPTSIRAPFFSLRNNACSAVGIAMALGAGHLLDAKFGGVPRGGLAATSLADGGDGLWELRATGFLVVFSVAAACGLAGAVLLHRQPEPARPAPDPASPLGLRDLIVRPFRAAFAEPGLRGFLLFVGLFGFVNGFAAPFWSPYMLEELHLPYKTVNGTLVLVQGLAVACALPIWGRIARRFGNRVVVLMALCLICTHPLYYLVATPARWWPIVCDSMSSGVAWSGYNFAIFNLALGLSKGPRPERTFAVYAATAGVAQASSSALAGAVVGLLPYHVDLGGLVLDRRQLVFLGACVLRAGCVALFLSVVREARGAPLRSVLAAIPYAVKALTVQFKPLASTPRPRPDSGRARGEPDA